MDEAYHKFNADIKRRLKQLYRDLGVTEEYFFKHPVHAQTSPVQILSSVPTADRDWLLKQDFVGLAETPKELPWLNSLDCSSPLVLGLGNLSSFLELVGCGLTSLESEPFVRSL